MQQVSRKRSEWRLDNSSLDIIEHVGVVCESDATLNIVQALAWNIGTTGRATSLPPADAAKKYVEFMGGANALLKKAQTAYDNNEYRWVAEVVNHLVFADPGNQAALELQASALEQLGYQSESGQWRNFYLTGARELRNGVSRGVTVRTVGPDMISALTLDMFFNYAGVRLNGPKAAGEKIVLNFDFADSGDQYLVDVSNGVLHHKSGAQSSDADATVKLTRNALVALVLAGTPVETLSASGAISIDGNEDALNEMLMLLDNFEFWFNIVTP